MIQDANTSMKLPLTHTTLGVLFATICIQKLNLQRYEFQNELARE